MRCAIYTRVSTGSQETSNQLHTLREIGNSLDRWGVSLLEWFIEYLRVFFWQTNWLDASIFMLFWVVVAYLAILAIVPTKWQELQSYLDEKAERKRKYEEDEEYRRKIDAEQMLKDEAKKEWLKNTSFFERHPVLLVFGVLFVLFFLLPDLR